MTRPTHIPVLTAAEMRDVDRRTIELGIPGNILMENAGHRVVEYLAAHYAPLAAHRIAVLCGKGNNGGDGYVIARQLHTRLHPAALHVISIFNDDQATEPRRMLEVTGCPVLDAIPPEARHATVVIDAVLGTGISGAARGRPLEAIREINTGFPLARVLAVDLPSGMHADSGRTEGEHARADATVTFTAPKPCHVLAPNCDRLGPLTITQIGSPANLMSEELLHLTNTAAFAHLLAPRPQESNKGTYGHALVVGGAEGKSGAAEMTGLAALRAGAGLVTVASSVVRLNTLELMTEPLPGTLADLRRLLDRRDVIAIGPGLGTSRSAVTLVRDAAENLPEPMVLDADALNALAGHTWRAPAAATRILTPHPGEMARLANLTVPEVQADRVAVARAYAETHNATVVLKGHRTVVATPDGHAFVNPTGSPGMATGGTGDILTGLIAGFLAQDSSHPLDAALAAVWLHGRAGELGAARLGEHSLLATDLLTYLPEAIRDIQNLANRD